MNDWYNEFFEHHHHHHSPRIDFITLAVQVSGITLIGTTAMSASLNDLQSLPLSIEADDALGTAVTLPAGASVAYTSDSPVLAITAGVDGVTAVAKATGAGTANVTAVLTLADGTTFTSPALAVTVVSSAIASIKIVPGTPA